MAIQNLGFCVVGVTVLLAGCTTARQVRDPEYAQVRQSMQQAWRAPTPAYDAVNPVVSALEGPHPVEAYVQYALTQNPDIQVARKRLESFAYQVPVAASLDDPMLGVTAFPEQVQTAAGRQELLLTASQKVPWFGKLRRRAGVAEAQANVARAQLAVAELETIEQVKRAYFGLYFIQQAIEITVAEKDLLGRIRDVADTRYRSNQTNYQDVLRADLEISNVESDLIRLRQQLDSSQAKLARLLHIAPQTELLTLRRLPPEQVPRDLEWLKRQAVSARPELHAQLAALQRDRQTVDLARLDYYPDVTLGATWIDVATAGISPVANGRDAFLIGATINLPIYRKRLDSSVRSAEARTVSTARQYDSLSDRTQEEVFDLFVQAHSQQDLLRLFHDDILPQGATDVGSFTTRLQRRRRRFLAIDR